MGESGYGSRPDYRVDVLARRNRVTATVGGLLVADSTHGLIVDEQDHGLVVYFPPADVRLELFVRDDRTSYCPFKGQATYRRLDRAGVAVLAWSYEEPYPEVARLAGHVAFFQDVVEVRLGAADPPVSGR